MELQKENYFLYSRVGLYLFMKYRYVVVCRDADLTANDDERRVWRRYQIQTWTWTSRAVQNGSTVYTARVSAGSSQKATAFHGDSETRRHRCATCCDAETRRVTTVGHVTRTGWRLVAYVTIIIVIVIVVVVVDYNTVSRHYSSFAVTVVIVTVVFFVILGRLEKRQLRRQSAVAVSQFRV